MALSTSLAQTSIGIPMADTYARITLMRCDKEAAGSSSWQAQAHPARARQAQQARHAQKDCAARVAKLYP
jgi:hypothetical protein